MKRRQRDPPSRAETDGRAGVGVFETLSGEGYGCGQAIDALGVREAGEAPGKIVIGIREG